jgi:hypothetical protein
MDGRPLIDISDKLHYLLVDAFRNGPQSGHHVKERLASA